MFDRQDVKI